MVKRIRRALPASTRAICALLLCAGCEATVDPTDDGCVGDECRLEVPCAENGCAGTPSRSNDGGTNEADDDAPAPRPVDEVAPVPTLEVVDGPMRDAGPGPSQGVDDAGRGARDAGSSPDGGAPGDIDEPNGSGDASVSPPVVGIGDAGDAGGDAGADGGLGDAGDAGTNEATVEAGAPPVQLPPCNSGAFLAPVPLEDLGVSGDYWGPAWSPDGLVLYFSVSTSATSNTDFAEAIYRTERADRDSPFENAEPVTELNLDIEQGTPHVSADGRLVFFFVEGDTGRDLYAGTLDATSGSWTNLAKLPTVNANANDDLPWFSIDGSTLYFTSGRLSGEGDDDLWISTRSASGYSTPVGLSELNTAASEGSPTLTPDELTLYFASERSSVARLRVYMGTRETTNDAFANATLVDELSEAGDTQHLALSRDGHEMAMASNRDGAQRLWLSRRDCPPPNIPLPAP